MPRTTALLAVLLAMATPRVSRAQKGPEPAPPASPAESGTTAPRAGWPEPVRWNRAWPRVHWIEVAVALTAGVGTFLATRIPVRDRSWGTNGLDDGVRDALLLRDPSARSAARNLSDGLFFGMLAFPFVDALAVGLPRNVDAGWQMLVIDAQSVGLSGFTSVVVERSAGRARPFVRECAANPNYYDGCARDDEKYQSFFSGHTMMSFTSAGLTCAHHTHLPLYGGGAVDIIACAVVLTAAAAEPVLRIAADHHYATDVTVGAVLGFASGYALPMALHYGRGAAAPAMAVVPWAAQNDWGLRLARAF